MYYYNHLLIYIYAYISLICYIILLMVFFKLNYNSYAYLWALKLVFLQNACLSHFAAKTKSIKSDSLIWLLLVIFFLNFSCFCYNNDWCYLKSLMNAIYAKKCLVIKKVETHCICSCHVIISNVLLTCHDVMACYYKIWDASQSQKWMWT